MTVYADDSGNTGPNLLDCEQPFGVTAMLIVDAAVEQDLRQACDALFPRGQRRPRELKYAVLAKRTSGARAVGSAMEILGDSGVQAFVSVTEKSYLAASLFGDTFLDPFCTEGVPKHFAQREGRTIAANLVHAVASGDVLGAFMHAFRKRDAAGLTAGAKAVASLLRFHPTPEAPELADVILSVADRPYVSEGGSDVPALALRPAPHTFNFLSLLSAVDRRLRTETRHGRLIADSDLQFGPVLDFAFKCGQREDLLPTPYSEHIEPLTNIATRSEAGSHAVLGLQLADLCAGLITAVVRAASDGRPAHEIAGWPRLRSLLLGCAPSGYWQVSERVLRRIAPTFLGLLPALEPGSWRW